MLLLQPEEDVLHSPLFLHTFRLNRFPILIGTHELPNEEKRNVLLLLGIGKDELLSVMKKRKQLHSLFGEICKPSIMVTHL